MWSVISLIVVTPIMFAIFPPLGIVWGWICVVNMFGGGSEKNNE
jgi:hypothetical protein